MQEYDFEDLINRTIIREKKSKRLLFLLLIIPIALGLYYLYYTYEKAKETGSAIIENVELRDSKKILSIQADSFEQIESREDLLKSLTMSYFRYNDKKMSDSLEGLFVDTLARYYKKTNIKKGDVRAEQIQFWGKYPEQSVDSLYDFSLEIDSLANATAQIKIDFKKREKDKHEVILTEFKFDKDNRIYSVRGYQVLEKTF
jgi:hypothetical protein